jgi:hypothetical protein
MKTNWRLDRSFVAQADGQCRWDYVYQYLLQWAMEQRVDEQSAPSHSTEEDDGNRHLCSRINSASTTSADH